MQRLTLFAPKHFTHFVLEHAVHALLGLIGEGDRFIGFGLFYPQQASQAL